MSTEHIDAGKRLDCLSRLALALGTALDGMSRAKTPDPSLSEIAQQLVYVSKQASWLARTSDPLWIRPTPCTDEATQPAGS